MCGMFIRSKFDIKSGKLVLCTEVVTAMTLEKGMPIIACPRLSDMLLTQAGGPDALHK